MIRNHKAQEAGVPWILIALLAAVIVGVIYLIASGTLAGLLSDVKEKAECGNLIGTGECKTQCDLGEDSYPNAFGCPPKKDKTLNVCCITLEEGVDTANYGGDEQYNFEALYVDLADASKARCNPKTSPYSCPAGSYQLKIGIKNTGRNPIDVSPNPKVDNTDNWPFGSPMTIAAGQTKDIFININIAKGKTYKINPAGKCLSTICTTKFGTEGIFKINTRNYIIVTGT